MGDDWKDLGKFTRKMDWWLPEERGEYSQASRLDPVGAALGDSSCRIASLLWSTMRPGLGVNKFDPTAPSAIACSSVISAVDDKQ